MAGALAGATAAIVLLLTIGLLPGALLLAALAPAGYALAAATAARASGALTRGLLVGLNAGANAVLASALFGPVAGVALGAIDFLAAFDPLARRSAYQTLLGWTSWLQPLSWPATGAGILFALVNALYTAGERIRPRGRAIRRLSLDWPTGTIIVEGGLLFPRGYGGGYNLGNFVFLTAGWRHILAHETGHTLNVAAFGSLFHYVGAIDENFIQACHADAYAERIADSHAPDAAGRTIRMWG